MDLDKMNSGTPVTLKVKRESTVADFDTVLIDHVGNCLVCQPMMHEGKIINFAISGVTHEVNIFDKDVGKLYAWRNIEIKAGYYKKTTLCHLIYLNSVPVEINRRNNYRQYIGIDCKAEVFHRPVVNVVLRDVSNNGVGFVAAERAYFEVGRMVKVSFSDEGGRFKFDLPCEIVRERELENGSIEYGCRVTEPPQSLANYVAHKQLEERKRVLGML